MRDVVRSICEEDLKLSGLHIQQYCERETEKLLQTSAAGSCA